LRGKFPANSRFRVGDPFEGCQWSARAGAGFDLFSRRGVIRATTPAATAPRPHAPTSIGTKSLTYDANGNMLTDGSRVMTWDGANRLASGTISASGYSLAMGYGPDGSRAFKDNGTTAVLFPDATVEINTSLAGAQAYVRIPHPDVQIKGGVVNYSHADRLASIRAITGPTGSAVSSTSYAAYGERQMRATRTSELTSASVRIQASETE
jgi:hypothetical protein